MKIKTKIFFMLFLSSLFMSGSAAVFGAVLTVSSTGNGTFAVQGAGLVDVAGINATIIYDTATLANPRVSQGGLITGAMMVPDTNSPGTIRIVIVTTQKISGNGSIASIRFDKKGGSSGTILSLNAKMISVNGVSLPVQTQVNNPAVESVPSDTTNTTATTGTTTQTSRAAPDNTSTAPGPKYLGQSGVNLPSETGETIQQEQAPEASPNQVSPEGNETQTLAPETESQTEPKNSNPQPSASVPGKKFVVYKSVLDRFREYNGENSVKSLVALFTKETMPGISQEPDIGLSDGKTSVTVSVRAPATGIVAPNFVLKGAKLVSMKMDGDTWVIQALPDRNVYQAAITILNSGSMVEVPLTVAPLIDSKIFTTGTLDEAAFNLFIKERGTEKAPRFDLNGDGVRNYIDDYIFTANFIVKRDSANKPVPGQKK